MAQSFKNASQETILSKLTKPLRRGLEVTLDIQRSLTLWVEVAEEQLVKNGVRVVVIPMDAVLSVSAYAPQPSGRTLLLRNLQYG